MNETRHSRNRPARELAVGDIFLALLPVNSYENIAVWSEVSAVLKADAESKDPRRAVHRVTVKPLFSQEMSGDLDHVCLSLAADAVVEVQANNDTITTQKD